MLAAILGPKRERYVYLAGMFCALLVGVAAYVFLHNAWLLLIFMGFFAWKNWTDFNAASR